MFDEVVKIKSIKQFVSYLVIQFCVLSFYINSLFNSGIICVKGGF